MKLSGPDATFSLPHHIPFTNARSIFASMLAEHVMGSVWYFSKEVWRLQQNKTLKRWERYPMRAIRGATMSVVGYGDIGRNVARLARSYGMRVLAAKRSGPDSVYVDDLGVEVHTAASVREQRQLRQQRELISTPQQQQQQQPGSQVAAAAAAEAKQRSEEAQGGSSSSSPSSASSSASASSTSSSSSSSGGHDADDVGGCEAAELFDAVAPQADYVVCVLPLTAATRHAIARENLKRLKPSAVLINIGRGETLVEADVAAALSSGEIRGAALDVFTVEPLPRDSPLWGMSDDRLLLSPHNADIEHGGFEAAAQQFLDYAREHFLPRRPFPYLVDLARGY